MNCAAIIDRGQNDRELSYEVFVARGWAQMQKRKVRFHELILPLYVIIPPGETRRPAPGNPNRETAGPHTV